MIKTKAILIIGGSGFLGSHLATRLREGYKVFATHCKNSANIPGVVSIPFNVDNKNWVKRILYTTRPDIIIYVAGSNSPENASKHMRKAELHHSAGPATLASSIDILQPKFIYVSNPYIFDGSRGNYHENDIPLPINDLGKLKLGGENVVKGKCLNYIILRSSPLIGRGNGLNTTFIDKLRIKLDRNMRCEFSQKEYHSFAPVNGFCDLMIRIVDSGIRNRVIHYGGLTKLSYYDFARAFAKHFKYNPSLIAPKTFISQDPIYTDDTIFDFSLNSTQMIETLKIKPLFLEESFDLIQKQLIPF